MPALHIRNMHRDDRDPADAQAGKMGDPEHFRRFCRSHPEHPVQCFVRVEGFKVPKDGVWMVNGLYRFAGTETTLELGDKVTFHPTIQNPEDDKPQASGMSLGRVAAARVDPITARRLQFVAPRQAMQDRRWGR